MVAYDDRWLTGPIYVWQKNRTKTFEFCDVLEVRQDTDTYLEHCS
jgi:hypothetical protein